MKTNTGCYVNYPWYIVLISNSTSFLIYFFGSLIMVTAGWIPLTLYLAFLIILEIRLLRVSCTRCCYYGKICAFGKGKIASLFFRQQDHSLFASRNVTWYSLIPDMLVLFIPVLTGIILLMADFKWGLLLLLATMIALGTFVTGAVRTSLACNYCNQRLEGCPAEKMFNKK